MRIRLVLILVVGLGLAAFGQVETLPSSPNGPGKTQAPPRSDRNKEAEESSSRDTRIDIRPPKNDAKDHPESSAAPDEDKPADDSDVQEFHPWDPHKAAKDVEVGDFYFKRKNYRAALDRYKEALVYKNNDAMANLRLGETYEKLNQPQEAIPHYEAYLKILPHGPFSEQAEKALERLKKGQ
ncbi:MAG TPA: tetratricopeptide repeat protein [Terriglobales bacterium]|nr:tetratricopeptide repeat protein [Terriglobales bacterium]